MSQDFIEVLPKLTGYHDQDLLGIWSKVYDPLFCEVNIKIPKINMKSDLMTYAYFETDEYIFLCLYKIYYIAFDIEI